MNAPTPAIRIGPGALPSQNSRNPVLMPATASSFARAGSRRVPAMPATTARNGDGEQPVFEPRRGSCEAGRGEDEEWRRRQHRQECADKTEGDEEKAENEIDAAHRPQPASPGENLQLRSRHAATPRGDQAGCAQHDGRLKKTPPRMMRRHRRRWSSGRKSVSIGYRHMAGLCAAALPPALPKVFAVENEI